MIKMDRISLYDPAKGHISRLTGRIVCKTKAKTLWFSLHSHKKHRSVKIADELVIAPQLISIWSK